MACGPCDTTLPQITRFSYSSLRRVDSVRKANRALQLNDGDSARTRDTESEGEIARKETEIGGMKRIWCSRLKGVPQREGCGSSDSEEVQSVS